jgi:hypothetical protein
LKARIFLAFLGLSTFVSVAALAADPVPDDTTTDSAKATPKPGDPKSAEEPSYGHFFQFGLRAGLVGGYNMIFRYDQSPYCVAPDFVAKSAKDQQKFCGHAAPLAMDVAVSFAPLNFVEPYIFGRFGLKGESQTDTQPLSVFGVGTRVYTMSDSAFKIFIDPALAYEFEGGGSNPVYAQFKYKKDLLFHLAAGPQFDLAKYFGIFVDAGLTTGILRSIHSELELQGGLQARFP